MCDGICEGNSAGNTDLSSSGCHAWYAKDKLREAFAAAKVSAEIEVYSALHGWCVSDMPIRDRVPIYNKAETERAWAKLVALYKAALASAIPDPARTRWTARKCVR
jgi:hypothetical protein